MECGVYIGHFGLFVLGYLRTNWFIVYGMTNHIALLRWAIQGHHGLLVLFLIRKLQWCKLLIKHRYLSCAPGKLSHKYNKIYQNQLANTLNNMLMSCHVLFFHRNRTFWLVCFTYGLSLGVLGCWTGVLDVNLSDHGISQVSTLSCIQTYFDTAAADDRWIHL